MLFVQHQFWFYPQEMLLAFVLAVPSPPPPPPPAALWAAAASTGPSSHATSAAGCPDRCSFHGTCSVKGGVHECTCYPGFAGPACADRACPHTCLRHGTCSNGQCICDAQHAGVDCSLRTCPGNGCSGQGFCDLVTGTCTCRAGFGGSDCALRLCPSDCSGEHLRILLAFLLPPSLCTTSSLNLAPVVPPPTRPRPLHRRPVQL